MRFIIALVPFTLVMLAILIASTVGIAAVFLYSWLWTLISPLLLWQIAILMVIVAIPMILVSGDMIVNESGEPVMFLLLGTPVAVEIALLLGWILTLLTTVDRWQATLLSTLIVSALFYTMLRIAAKMMEVADPFDEWASEEDDEYELDDSDIERVIWLANKNNKPRRGRQK